MNQWISRLFCPSISLPITGLRQSISQSLSLSVCQSVNQSVLCLIGQSISQWSYSIFAFWGMRNMFFLYVHRSCCLVFPISSTFLTKLLFCKYCPPLSIFSAIIGCCLQVNALLLDTYGPNFFSIWLMQVSSWSELQSCCGASGQQRRRFYRSWNVIFQGMD